MYTYFISIVYLIKNSFIIILGPGDCCAVQNTSNIPPQCQAVINISVDDPVYSTIKKTCLPFRRAMTSTLNFNCDISPQIPVSR